MPALAKISRSSSTSGNSWSANRTLGIGDRRRAARRGSHAATANGTRRRVPIVKRPDRFAASRATQCIARLESALEPPRRRPTASTMTTLLRTTIAGSLPKPAWLAEPEALWAPWKLEGAALAEGKRDAVRLVAARPGAGGHRHRHRRRADAPPFRHDVHRGPRRRRLRAQEDGAHPQPLRRRRAGGRRARSRAGTRSSSTTRAFLRVADDRDRSSSRCPGR